MVRSILEQHRAVANGPLRPGREQRRQALADEAAKAKGRAKGKPRTPAEVDQVLDLILEHLALNVDS